MKELTVEERKAAVAEAIKKRNADNKMTSNEEAAKLASSIKNEKEKRGYKKEKKHGNEEQKY